MNKKNYNSGLGKDNILQNRFTAYVEKALINNRFKYMSRRSRHNNVELCGSLNNIIDEGKFVSDTDEVFDAAFGLEFDSIDDIRLYTALKSLDGKDLMIIKLHVFYEYTFEKIAVVMGMSMSTVKSRYNRAIYRIRERMEDFK